MFDIGFSEIFVIAVVALIVIGPERLPRVAKTLGHLFGRMQRYVAEVKADVNREIELDELRKLQSSMQDAARSFEQSVTSQVSFIESEVRQTEAEVQKQVQAAVAPVSGIHLMPAVSAPEAETTTETSASGQSELDLDPDKSSNTAGKHG
jgi:sec-independent protein translocase protein TatB